MIRPEINANRRPGTTMIETALALPICLLLLFGIFEYGRYVMIRNLVANAAREAARFAVVHTSDKTLADVQNTALAALSTQQTQLQALGVQVYATDANGNQITGVAWTTAAFSHGIGVQIDGDYKPLMPTFLAMPSLLHVSEVAVMMSEAS